jgi:hypothetical protein
MYLAKLINIWSIYIYLNNQQLIFKPLINFYMKRILAFIIILIAFTQHHSFSQEESSDERTFIGINPAHTIIIQAVSKAIDKNVSYLPVHIIASHAITEHVGISGLFMYRLDKDGDYFLTHEFGFAVGPAYLFKKLNGLYADIKLGLGYAFGTDYNNSDYNRTDLIIEPDIGYYLCFKSRFTMAIGIGLQSLVKLSESYYGDIWEWNSTGKLSHYYLPVANISVGIKL